MNHHPSTIILTQKTQKTQKTLVVLALPPGLHKLKINFIEIRLHSLQEFKLA